MRSRFAILNCAFDPLTEKDSVDRIFQIIHAGQRGWACTVNVSTLMMMRTNRELKSFVDKARLIIADGQPLVWVAPLFGGSLPERVAGVDLIDALCARAHADKVPIYLLGATPEIVEKVVARLCNRYPGLNIQGSDGYFRQKSIAQTITAINNSGAKLLFVGMGSPLQESFIRRHWTELGVSMAIGVGGSFDVFAGLRVRAPPWMQSIGLEWLVRLAQEPRRLMPRYLATNTQFCFLIAQIVLRRIALRNTCSDA
jgi:N-acetylglucosaminyldiphosphoundecaprenol N-acetyl-beta-D-mannosaminyltransferase